MVAAPKKKKKVCSYADYCEINDGKRYEEVYDASSTFAVAQFPGLEIDCGKIFPKNQEE